MNDNNKKSKVQVQKGIKQKSTNMIKCSRKVKETAAKNRRKTGM